MNRTKKYLLALLPAVLALWAGCSNMMEELGKTASKTGSGFPANAVFINTADELNAVRNDLAGYYVLMADIDLSGYAAGEGWVPIGDSTNRFTGTLDGNGHTITNLTINRSADDYQGLFGCIGDGGTIINLGVSGSVTGNSLSGGLVGLNYGTIRGCYAAGVVYGNWYVGGLVGYSYGTISGCYATGDVDGYCNVGGLVGYNYGSVSGCYATGDVDGYDYTGGLVGENSDTIRGCFATGEVTGTNIYVGGLMGCNSINSTLENCYAAGNVSGNSYIGGLMGGTYGTVKNCYAMGTVNGSSYDGGLIGDFNFGFGSISSSYYYQGDDNGYGTQVPFADMKRQEIFIGWDFTTVWAIDDTGTINSGYPYLRSIMP